MLNLLRNSLCHPKIYDFGMARLAFSIQRPLIVVFAEHWWLTSDSPHPGEVICG
jgi:hypothetical protein